MRFEIVTKWMLVKRIGEINSNAVYPDTLMNVKIKRIETLVESVLEG
jgi:hypothetical protein